MKFYFRGLEVDAEMSPVDPGDWLNPPTGGDCEDYTWEVDDINEVLEHLGLDGRARDCYEKTGELPAKVVERINQEWDDDIAELAAEKYNEQ
tara:strand:+ start:45 stop:320 length:276 start_codon:yes stop_codon:yes gene_type:complete